MHVRLDITGPDMYEDIMTIQSMYLLEPTPLITEAVVRAALGITSITPAWNLPSISKLPAKETFFHSTVIYLFTYLFFICLRIKFLCNESNFLVQIMIFQLILCTQIYTGFTDKTVSV